MKLQHNSSGESSEDLIALIIAVRREREGKESMKRRSKRRKQERKRSDVMQMLQV